MRASSLVSVALAAAASLALGGTLLWLAGGSGGSEDFAEPGELRFRNVVIKLPPESSGLRVSTGEPITEGQKWVVRVSDREMQRTAGGLLANVVEIDADTGEVLSDTLSAKYPAEARDVLATVRVDMPESTRHLGSVSPGCQADASARIARDGCSSQTLVPIYMSMVGTDL